MTFWSNNSIDFLCGFPKANKKILKLWYIYEIHFTLFLPSLCYICLFTHIKTPQSSFNWIYEYTFFLKQVKTRTEKVFSE